MRNIRFHSGVRSAVFCVRAARILLSLSIPLSLSLSFSFGSHAHGNVVAYVSTYMHGGYRPLW